VEQLETVEVRHPDVDERDVRSRRRHHVHRLGGRTRFDDLGVAERLPHDVAQPAAHERVIVDDEDLHDFTP
jgi:hypothetical protein